MSACSPDGPANSSITKPTLADTASPAVPGGWVPSDAFSPDVQEAARFAVQTFAVQNKQRVLYKDVTQARQQVVAGLQFELALQVTLDETKRHAKAVVWRQPDGVYQLRSWTWLD
ncbi:cystatin domain-containing protein [Limnohabitans sp.]|uniref:cystatin domain-containing protein n=1 Tax=Limnohabitans sp. TaxID=1907725 RepID=UPI0039BD3898|nr:cystatin domain-containing protein [Comamonadaceae bacterium]